MNVGANCEDADGTRSGVDEWTNMGLLILQMVTHDDPQAQNYHLEMYLLHNLRCKAMAGLEGVFACSYKSW